MCDEEEVDEGGRQLHWRGQRGSVLSRSQTCSMQVIRKMTTSRAQLFDRHRGSRIKLVALRGAALFRHRGLPVRNQGIIMIMSTGAEVADIERELTGM